MFRWEPAPYQAERNGQLCDVDGVGRLLARRLAKGTRLFTGYINGKSAIVEVSTIDEAKRALEVVARRMIEAEKLRTCP